MSSRTALMLGIIGSSITLLVGLLAGEGVFIFLSVIALIGAIVSRQVPIVAAILLLIIGALYTFLGAYRAFNPNLALSAGNVIVDVAFLLGGILMIIAAIQAFQQRRARSERIG